MTSMIKYILCNDDCNKCFVVLLLKSDRQELNRQELNCLM